MWHYSFKKFLELANTSIFSSEVTGEEKGLWSKKGTHIIQQGILQIVKKCRKIFNLLDHFTCIYQSLTLHLFDESLFH